MRPSQHDTCHTRTAHQDKLQLFLVLCVGVLQRPFFVSVREFTHCDDVKAYDLRCDLTDGGNGRVSMA